MATKRVLGLRFTAASGATYVVRQGLTPAQRKSPVKADKIRKPDPLRIVEPNVDYLKLCRPVSLAASEEVWDTSGGVGQKNRQFLPVFHPCRECPKQPAFPRQLQTISPAKKGELFYDFDEPPLGQDG